MDDGERVEIRPFEIFDVPPGHDAWVVGDQPAVLLDFLGNLEDGRLRFESRGAHDLKGLPTPLEVFALVD